MRTTRYIVTVGQQHKFTVDTSDALHRDYFGETADEIAHRAATDYCDSGTVTVVRADGEERATVARR